ncbi:hypothetical protein E2C01_009163 [Portunus trituberculatus]|uniref:Uncharacterized protein n=1 Tax=Portunus trituberculatus TaxID=210409 RepID=A0A5B7D3U1_PORTR|nr:hypothetical protein [Portunus trituberculatus]
MNSPSGQDCEHLIVQDGEVWQVEIVMLSPFVAAKLSQFTERKEAVNGGVTWRGGRLLRACRWSRPGGLVISLPAAHAAAPDTLLVCPNSRRGSRSMISTFPYDVLREHDFPRRRSGV